MPLGKRFAQKAMRRPDEFDDLMNEAAIIIRRCAETFDPEKGNRFSSYAMAALRELKRRSPSYGTTRYTARQVNHDNFKSETNARRLDGTSQNDPVSSLIANRKTRQEVENARRLLASSYQSDQDNDNFELDPVDERCKSPFDQVVGREDRERLLEAFSRLSWLEKKVLVGKTINDHSYRNMGRRYRKSPQTLSKICDEALKKLGRELDPERIPNRPR